VLFTGGFVFIFDWVFNDTKIGKSLYWQAFYWQYI